MRESVQQIRELGGASLFVSSASQNADGFVEDRIEIHEIGRAALESLPKGLSVGMPMVSPVH